MERKTEAIYPLKLKYIHKVVWPVLIEHLFFTEAHLSSLMVLEVEHTKSSLVQALTRLEPLQLWHHGCVFCLQAMTLDYIKYRNKSAHKSGICLQMESGRSVCHCKSLREPFYGE